MIGRSAQIILLIVVLSLLAFATIYSQLDRKLKERSEDEPPKIKKIANLRAKTGLVVEVFEIRTHTYVCVIPIQTTNAGPVQRMSDISRSLAPTLSCIKK